MSNKKIIQKVFDEELNGEKIKQQILLEYERKGKSKMNKIIKYAVISVCLVFTIFIGISFNKGKDIEGNVIGTMKVYAYTMSEDEKVKKMELKDNIKLGLASYNLAMSSVPGYPIEFEINGIDLIKIEIINGTIFDWNRETGEVKNIGSSYQLTNNGTLYFHVNESTHIKIKGIKDKEEIFEKDISISSDDDFNYYAVLK